MAPGNTFFFFFTAPRYVTYELVKKPLGRLQRVSATSDTKVGGVKCPERMLRVTHDAPSPPPLLPRPS